MDSKVDKMVIRCMCYCGCRVNVNPGHVKCLSCENGVHLKMVGTRVKVSGAYSFVKNRVRRTFVLPHDIPGLCWLAPNTAARNWTRLCRKGNVAKHVAAFRCKPTSSRMFGVPQQSTEVFGGIKVVRYACKSANIASNVYTKPLELV